MNPFFDYYELLWSKSSAFTTENMPVNGYVYTRMASFQPDALSFTNALSKHAAIPTKYYMMSLYYGLPKRRPRPKKLPKKSLDKLSPTKQRQLDRIMKRFNVSEQHGLQIMDLLIKQKVNIGE